MTLLLRNHEVRGLLAMSDYIDAVERGYLEKGSGRGVNFPRHNMWLKANNVNGGEEAPPSNADGSFKFKGAMLPGLGGMGVQPYSTGFESGLQTYMFLFDTQSGELASVMEVLYYDWLKTAATAAVATKYLAPVDSSVAAIFGTGRHARTQLHGLCAVRPIKRVQAYSRTSAAREAFCEKMSEELAVDVVSCESPEEALAGAEIITTMTTSRKPVFDGMLLGDGPLHINAMGAHYPWNREIDEFVVSRSRVVLDDWEQGLQEHGEVMIPIEQGLMNPSDIHGDLGEVVAGRIRGRGGSRDWTLFLSGGTGIEDVAVATVIYQRAREVGIGTEFEFGQRYEFEL